MTTSEESAEAPTKEATKDSAKAMTTVAVFVDRATAEHAIEELKRAGFDSGDIACESEKLGLLDRLTMPSHEAKYLQAELESGRTVVTVEAKGRYQEADTVLRRFGAYVYNGPYQSV